MANEFWLKQLKSKKFPKQIKITSFERGHDCGRVVDLVPKGWCKERLLVAGHRVYEMLCAHGLYSHLDNGEITLPEGKGKLNKGQLSGMMACGDPTIIDLLVGSRNVHVVDLKNWGLDYAQGVDNAQSQFNEYCHMVSMLDMGSLADTAAGQGLNRFRHGDMRNVDILCHVNMDVRSLERRSYHAGRSEARFVGKPKHHLWHVDVKSMYAWLGLTKKFPNIMLENGWGDSKKKMLKNIGMGRQVIADCLIETDSPWCPVKYEGSAVYPVGRFRTCLAWPEFQYALDHGCVKKVFQWSSYSEQAMFVRNSNWFFEAKESLKRLGLESMAGPLKLAQNCMYGNIGRRGRLWQNTQAYTDFRWGQWYGENPVHGNLCMLRAINGHHQYLDDAIEPETSCPFISATMNSYGRMLLWELICCAGIENVYYYDTDGILVNDAGYNNLLRAGWIEPFTPGKLSVKEQGADVEIFGMKSYRFGSRWCQAGVPKDAIRDKKGNATFDEHVGFNYSLWHNNPFVHEYKITKRMSKQPYRHGCVSADGRVLPLSMDYALNRETGIVDNVLC